MNKGRIEAFSDGVIAILITIMVLEIKVPVGTDWGSVRPLVPVLLSYVLSFIYLGIYWSNHHHLFQIVKHVSGRILWANLHLLFWLSLVPLVTQWVGENSLTAVPLAMYGIVLFFASIAYYILARLLVADHGANSALASAIGSDVKGRISTGLYVAGIGMAFVAPWISCAFYIAVAVIWLVPDRRIERVVQ